MLVELLDLYRGDLAPDVTDLAEQTIAAFAPSAQPDADVIALLDARWAEELDGDGVRTYNASCFCQVVAQITADLTSDRRAVAICLSDALVGWDLRPPAPAVPEVDRIATARADRSAPEIIMIRRFIHNSSTSAHRRRRHNDVDLVPRDHPPHRGNCNLSPRLT